MRAFLPGIKAKALELRGTLLSTAAHLSLLLCLVGGWRASTSIVPYRLPGTAMGNTVLTYYSPGSTRPAIVTTAPKSKDKAKTALVLHPKASKAQPDPSLATRADAGAGSATESGLGEGDIQIALETYFPYPKPDLSHLPRGTKGDVILDAVIDAHGNITTLTLLKGLGSPVDESVIATVQHWQYTPAMKNGVPVASERELHFHYERS
jgi:periplasmic protein TonB